MVYEQKVYVQCVVLDMGYRPRKRMYTVCVGGKGRMCAWRSIGRRLAGSGRTSRERGCVQGCLPRLLRTYKCFVGRRVRHWFTISTGVFESFSSVGVMVGMAFYRAASGILCTLLLSLQFLMVTSQIPTASPAPPTQADSPVATPPSAVLPAPPPANQPQPQVVNMIEALRDAGQFGAIAGLLDGLQMKNLTPMTTWLLPTDEAFSGASYPKNVSRFIDYHVVRELLPYSRLATLNVGTKLPTFLGNETVVVTNNLRSNYSLDNAMVVVPDLYSDSTVAVHGINAILNDADYNDGVLAPTPEARPGVPDASPPSSSSSSSPSTSTDEPSPINVPAAAPTMPTSMALSFALILTVATWIM